MRNCSATVYIYFISHLGATPLLPVQLEQMTIFLLKQIFSLSIMISLYIIITEVVKSLQPVLSDINIFPVADHPSFTLTLNGTNENATLVCSATGGYPPITNISLLKNGDVIASAASESTLQVNTADLPPNISHYGLYVCLVDFLGFPLYSKVWC